MPAPRTLRRRRLPAYVVAVLSALVAPLSPAQESRPAAPGSAPAAAEQADRPAVTFNTNFEGGSVGRVEKLSPTAFRVHVQGQHDERGRNRQASWFYFRMDHVRGRDLVVTMTDFVGEYDDKPGACPAGPDVMPVFSEDDGRSWRHFPAGAWDDAKKEMTLTFRPEADTIRLAQVPPYTPADLDNLLADVTTSPFVTVEVIGRTSRGRDLRLVTVTDPDVPDAGKKSLWLQARQHAWEAGTSRVAEGALRFLASDDPRARDLRRRAVFRLTPIVDVDGCAEGKVRFNANGYDVNRHWNEVDLRHPEFLRLMPEIWYTKKAIVAADRHDRGVREGGRGIDLLVNLHNTETAEYLETHARDAAQVETVRRLSDLLEARTTFDPSSPLAVRAGPVGTTNALSAEYGVPVVLMEQRIGTGKKLGRRPTVEDRLAFGRELALAMAEAVR